jgi:hypothetical protein
MSLVKAKRSVKRPACLFLVSVLCGCAAPQAAVERPRPGAAPSVTRASFRYQSWGATLHYWTLDEAGAVVWEAPERPGGSLSSAGGEPLTIAVKRFQLDPGRRAALAAAIAHVERTRALPDTCKTYIPDGPYGRLTWTVSGSERVAMANASCMKGPQADKSGAAFRVDRIVQDAAEAAPVVDRRQE